jgi:hypothetical protein
MDALNSTIRFQANFSQWLTTRSIQSRNLDFCAKEPPGLYIHKVPSTKSNKPGFTLGNLSMKQWSGDGRRIETIIK